MGVTRGYGRDCWNLIEEYWFLDSFGADLVLETEWME